MTAKKTQLRARSKDVRLPAQHIYQANGESTGPGFPQGCAHCPLPMGHEVHIQPPPVDEDTAALSRRMVGEGDR